MCTRIPHTTININKEVLNIDTSRLRKGQLHKNYKEICLFIKEPIKTGAAKQRQLEEWLLYFDYTIIGIKFGINKVYKYPKGKLSRYGYINDIEELIIDLLVQDENKGEVFLPKSKLFRLLNMTNDNYNYAKYHIPKLSVFTDISEEEIHEFYDLSKDSLTRSIDNALNQLRKKSLIVWSPVMTVCKINTETERNEAGIKIDKVYSKENEYGNKVYNYAINYRLNRMYREATREEKQAILAAERSVMDEYNCYDKQYIVKCGLWDDFTNKVKDIIFESHNILYYYDSYKITFNNESTEKARRDIKAISMEPELKRRKLSNVNMNIQKKLKDNAQARKDKAMIDFNEDSKKSYRLKGQYIKNNNKLVRTLIDQNAKNIRPDLENIRFNKGKLD